MNFYKVKLIILRKRNKKNKYLQGFYTRTIVRTESGPGGGNSFKLVFTVCRHRFTNMHPSPSLFKICTRKQFMGRLCKLVPDLIFHFNVLAGSRLNVNKYDLETLLSKI